MKYEREVIGLDIFGCSVYQKEEGDFAYHNSNHIGGSQAGVVLGVNKYTSPLELFMQKTDQIVNEKTDNKYAEWGVRLEPLVADKFAREHNEFQVTVVDEILQNKEKPFMLANIDRLLINKMTKEIGVLEIKTTIKFMMLI
jgi:putative phage-type endonuclease